MKFFMCNKTLEVKPNLQNKKSKSNIPCFVSPCDVYSLHLLRVCVCVCGLSTRSPKERKKIFVRLYRVISHLINYYRQWLKSFDIRRSRLRFNNL